MVTMLPMIRNRGYDFIDTFFDNFWATNDEVNTFYPKVDIHEDENNIYVEADVPGLDKKDITLNIENNVLKLSGTRTQTHEEKQKGYHRVERQTGKFERRFYLGENVDATGTKAEFEKGVLKVTVPKKEEVKPKTIEIEVK